MFDNHVREFLKNQMSDEDFLIHLEALKRNIQPDMLSSELTAEQNESLSRLLSDLLDKMSITPIGHQALKLLPNTTTFISVPRIEGDESTLGECIAPMQLVNVFPETLLNIELNMAEKMEVLGHECFHIVHHEMQKSFTIPKVRSKMLNAYDVFFLDLFDEAGAFLGGEEIGAQAGGALAPKNIEDFFFKQTPHYLENYFFKALKDFDQAGIQSISQANSFFDSVHTPTYYKIQAGYFKLHPSLMNVHLISRTHHSFRMFGKTMIDLLSTQDDKMNAFMEKLKVEKMSLPKLFAINCAFVKGRMKMHGNERET